MILEEIIAADASKVSSRIFELGKRVEGAVVVPGRRVNVGN